MTMFQLILLPNTYNHLITNYQIASPVDAICYITIIIIISTAGTLMKSKTQQHLIFTFMKQA